MNKHLQFSTIFPAYHPKAGQSTEFIEKIWSGLLQIDSNWYSQFLPGFDKEDDREFKLAYSGFRKFRPKYHTIREGHKFKVGDGIIPWHWAGKPYKSKWVKPFYNGDLVIPVENVWNFEVKMIGMSKVPMFFIEGIFEGIVGEVTLAENDGFKNIGDFVNWFSKPMKGQIICWSKEIRYLESDPHFIQLAPTAPNPNPNRKIIKMP